MKSWHKYTKKLLRKLPHPTEKPQTYHKQQK